MFLGLEGSPKHLTAHCSLLSSSEPYKQSGLSVLESEFADCPCCSVCHTIFQIRKPSCLSTPIMPRAIATTKKKKEYATEVTWIAKRSRRGHVKHHKINVTPSSTQFSSSPVKHDSQEDELDVIPALSFSQPSNPSSPQACLSEDQNDHPGLETLPPSSNFGVHKSSKRGKACLLIHIYQFSCQFI